MTLSEPYVCITIIGLILSCIIYNFDNIDINKQTKISNFINIIKVMKWSGILYICVGIVVFLFVSLFYMLFTFIYLLSNNPLYNPLNEPSVMQGVGWIILIFVCVPLEFITPIIIIYNIFIFLSDSWKFILRQKNSLNIKFLTIMENLSFLNKHNRINLFLDIIGITVFLVIFLFCLSKLDFVVSNSEQKFYDGAIRAQRILSGVHFSKAYNDDVNIDKLTAEQITDIFAQALVCNKTSPTKIEFQDNMIAEFVKTGNCFQGNCKIIVDLNGNKKPNKKWTSESAPGDIIELTIIDNGKDVQLPIFINKIYK